MTNENTFNTPVAPDGLVEAWSATDGFRADLYSVVGVEIEQGAKLLLEYVQAFPEKVQSIVLGGMQEQMREDVSREDVKDQVVQLMEIGRADGMTSHEAQPPGLGNGMIVDWLVKMQNLGAITINLPDQEDK